MLVAVVLECRKNETGAYFEVGINVSIDVDFDYLITGRSFYSPLVAAGTSNTRSNAHWKANA